MKAKIKRSLRTTRKNIIDYVVTNRLFLSYTILSLLGAILLRYFTIGHLINLKPILVDLSLILLIGSIAYLIKPKKQFNYLFIWLIVYTIMEVINSIYYTFYTNFASFSELATLSQAETVVGSVFERLKIIDFVYIVIPLIFYFIHKKLLLSPYYNFVEKIEKGKKVLMGVTLISVLGLAYNFATTTKSDYSRLSKQWNRLYIVERFGIIMYQFNDLFQTLTPRLSSLFGYNDALLLFKEFYSQEEFQTEKNANKYTDVLNGYNIIFVHMESIQTYLMNLTFNGVEATPNLNKLAQEGMFFANFYPQISTGTSSDTEFTLLSGLLPAASGTVFVSYYDRDYITIPKLLIEEGYYSFSMHGNLSSMWNRKKVHPLLGYEGMYFSESFDYTDEDVINLGISDEKFFAQAVPLLEKIESTYEKYMGTVITLSNHSPFTSLDKYGDYDLSTTYTDENGSEVKTNYLEGTPVGNYIHSSHYADKALGEFINYINTSPQFNNTVFVFYGDHDARLSRANLNYLYNYDYKTGELLTEADENYQEYDAINHELNKKTPLIIWTKNNKLKKVFNKQIDYVMGMYDVMPTLGNMLGISNQYALGHDIFATKEDNIVIFPSGNFLTNKIYYNNSTEEYKLLKAGAVLDEDYINNLITYTDKRLEVSNAIVVYNLLAESSQKDIKNLEKTK